MNDRLDERCRKAHEAFSKDHERLRREMLASLPSQGASADVAAGRSRRLRFTGEPKMMKRLIKIAAAAMVLIAVGVTAVVLVTKTATPAYAIEQTLAANEGLRFTHIRMTPAGKGVGEAWAQFDEDGELLRLRLDFPESSDGRKIVLWEQDVARVWLKDKGFLFAIREKGMLVKIKQEMFAFDPKVAMQSLQQRQAEGKMTIETHEPAEPGEPITLIATSLPEPTLRIVATVDPQTKLMTRSERYSLQDGEYVLQFALDYLDYNQPDETAFQPEISEDVVVIDQTRGDVGMARGDLSDEAVAEQVVRQFFQAVVDEDYDAAGNLLEGVPGELIRRQFGKTRFARVVSVGPAQPLDSKYGPGAMKVPCQVEIEDEDGQIVTKDFSPWVRSVVNQPDRRTIFGNI